MRRLIARRGRKMLRFDSWGSLRGHFFGCLPLGFVRKGSVTRLDGCDCALASGGGVGSMSDSRPELRSSVGGPRIDKNSAGAADHFGGPSAPAN